MLEGLGRCGETARRSLTRLAVSRRPPISLYKIVARTHMYTYAAQVWDSSLVQGPFLSPFVVPNLSVTIRNLFPSLMMMGRAGGRGTPAR